MDVACEAQPCETSHSQPLSSPGFGRQRSSKSRLSIHFAWYTVPPPDIPLLPKLRTRRASTMPPHHLRLLSLDGGGVRGLSSLMILRALMESIDPDSPPKPCEYFDMIGGTSTGGLIAVMLGRLEMTVDECIDAYVALSDQIFEKKQHRINIKGGLQGRYDSAALESAIKKILADQNVGEDALLKNTNEKACKV